MEGKSFTYKFSSWTNNISKETEVDWTKQLRILNEIAELITPQLSLEDIVKAIYQNVNQLMDAYQFGVGIYDEKEGLIYYKGMIENGKRFPDFSFKALDSGRLASWCIRHEQDIFMNDFDKEFSRYLPLKPEPLAGIEPRAAIYTPLRLNDKLAGLIVVRTIHKNVYLPHHLYILKAVGNFVVRALELANLSSMPSVQGIGRTKQWRWNNPDDLTTNSKKIFNTLTEREKDVLFLLISGSPNKVIAQTLFVSPDTIKTHTLNIYRKMHVGNRTSAILKAVELKWVV
jgi:DNA-binding CsgD family transcriptional regulator/transcriptional regulator with GAF, ATPase, and Fis domain